MVPGGQQLPRGAGGPVLGGFVAALRPALPRGQVKGLGVGADGCGGLLGVRRRSWPCLRSGPGCAHLLWEAASNLTFRGPAALAQLRGWSGSEIWWESSSLWASRFTLWWRTEARGGSGVRRRPCAVGVSEGQLHCHGARTR